jgi:hypothetical protein
MLKAQKHIDLARFELGGKFISDKKKFFETEQDWNHFSNPVNRFALITLRASLACRSPLRSGFVKKRNWKNHGWQNHFLAAVGWSARAVDKLTWLRALPLTPK